MAINADGAEGPVNGSSQVPTNTAIGLTALADPPSSGDSDPDADAGDTAGRSVEESCDDPDTGGEATGEQGDADVASDGADAGPRVAGSRTWPALAVGLVAVVALGGLGGWLGYGIYRDRQDDALRNQFLAAGRQGALNLTTIDYTHADADVQRILDSSTGQFRDDFSKHAPAFIDVVKRAQSKTNGNVTDAGLESSTGESARVLVAVSVNTTNAGAADQAPRHWRMRVDVQKVGDTMKVSNVGFVP
ncbi:mammalian cell entry protein [Mycobacterium sp. 050134]|uniref:mammalian cell entry protein n=1 Tax=Mycobacterium sp. 050134 TaxID=3096111 RepID=UPI002ED7DF2F